MVKGTSYNASACGSLLITNTCLDTHNMLVVLQAFSSHHTISESHITYVMIRSVVGIITKNKIIYHNFLSYKSYEYYTTNIKKRIDTLLSIRFFLYFLCKSKKCNAFVHSPQTQMRPQKYLKRLHL